MSFISVAVLFVSCIFTSVMLADQTSHKLTAKEFVFSYQNLRTKRAVESSDVLEISDVRYGLKDITLFLKRSMKSNPVYVKGDRVNTTKAKAAIFTGHIIGDSDSIVVVLLRDSKIMGMVHLSDGEDHSLTFNETLYLVPIVYNVSRDHPKHLNSCATHVDNKSAWRGYKRSVQATKRSLIPTCSTNGVSNFNGKQYNLRLAIESNPAYLARFASSTEASDYMDLVVATVSAIYLRDFYATVDLVIHNLDSPHGEDRDVMKTHYLANPPTQDYDFGIAVRGGSGGGYATVGGLCLTNKQFGHVGFATTYATSAYNAKHDIYILGHEIGHLIGSQHTFHSDYTPKIDDCDYNGINPAPADGGTIMSYCHTTGYHNINLYMGKVGAFGYQSERVNQFIRDYLEDKETCANLASEPYVAPTPTLPTLSGSVPGRIDAIEFVAFSDTTLGSQRSTFGDLCCKQDYYQEFKSSQYLPDIIPRDANGDCAIGNIEANEYIEYNVDFGESSQYTFELSYARGDSCDTSVTIIVDGVELETLNAPSTGDWNTYSTVSVHLGNYKIDDGEKTVRLLFPDGGLNIQWFDMQTAVPFLETISGTIPGLIRGSDFVDFLDDTLGVQNYQPQEDYCGKNPYIDANRATTNLPDLSKKNADGYCIVLRINANEYITYRVHVDAPGEYDFEIKISRGQPGWKNFEILVDDVSAGVFTMIPNLSWSTFVTRTFSLDHYFTEGLHDIKLLFLQSGTISTFYYQWFDMQLRAPSLPLHSGNAPDQIRAVDFVGFLDDSLGSEKPIDGDLCGREYYYNTFHLHANLPDIVPTNLDADGLCAIAHINNLEYVEYIVNTDTAGVYTFELNYARGFSGSVTVDIVVDSVAMATFTVSSTGGWYSYTTSSISLGSLSVGDHNIKLDFNAGVNYRWFKLELV